MESSEIPKKIVAYISKKKTAREAAEYFGKYFSLPVFNLVELTPQQIQKCDFIIFSICNYSDGAPPKDAKQWWNDLSLNEDPSFFSNLKFAIFGCGNSTFPHFLGFTIKFQEKLKSLGAVSITTMGANDASKKDQNSIIDWPKTFSIV